MEDRLQMPMVALRGLTVMPKMVTHFDVSRQKSIKAIEEAMVADQKIFLVAQKELEVADPSREDLYDIGTIAEIKQVVKLPKNLFRILVEGKERAQLVTLQKTNPFLAGEVRTFEDFSFSMTTEDEFTAMVRTLKDILTVYSIGNSKMNQDTLAKLLDMTELDELVDQTCLSLPLFYKEQQILVDAITLEDRYKVLCDLLTKETNVQLYAKEIQEKVKERVDKHQKEYYLREQLKVIREELGEDSALSDADAFEETVKGMEADEEVREKLLKEIRRFRNAGSNPAEQGVIRTYIETMLEMPWGVMTEDSHDMKRAQKILDEDHYGLEDVKERVLEFLAVRNLTQRADSPILCLVGPPGTGKTSVARSIARALEKKYVRISLGGVRDEAEIRGHRKTYIGAMPGRIANGLKQAGSKNPLMLLDEIDKVSTDYKGDTFSALLEVLDGEQNSHFRDHYLEVPLDLSQVLFITTANTTDTIPRPLLDRMEVISVGSYTENEKVHIAKEHLLPRQLEHHGIRSTQFRLSDTALEKLIRHYTREAGVRQLERKLGELCRKAARKILEDDQKRVSVTVRNLEEFLGKEKYVPQMANSVDEIGIVRGLAWTSVGGDTLQIEVNVMDGKGELLLTGQLGDVMKESARAGISYIRSVADRHGIAPEFFKEHDIHIHIPEGAVPKDGPSAGITMATAMLSAITETPVRADAAMTGEITLRGRVLPIGGLKEKLLAARNAGIRTVIVPDKNRRDVEELSEEITGNLEIVYAKQMETVIKTVFVKE